MSAKWERSKAWDDANLPRWAWPVKSILRLFSGIPLAVVLLSGVVLYGILASVPIGLLAKAPTYAFYGLTVAAAIAAFVGVGLFVESHLLRGAARPTRWAIMCLSALALAALAIILWARFSWPHLRYDRGTGQGVMFFADFVEQYKSTTLRRLPGLEMTELEFYSWWPLRVLLLTFVLNMIVATVRRIEFRFVNLGVLMVHSGIVLIALGSVYYGALKKEGECLLRAGAPGEDGVPGPGPWQMLFFDASKVALHARAELEGWQQIPLRGVPRYNDYGLDVSTGRTARDAMGSHAHDASSGLAPLSIATQNPRTDSAISHLRFRLVGYASYTEEQQGADWLRVDPSELQRIRPGFRLNPLRIVTTDFPASADSSQGAVLPWFFLPESPRGRLAEMPELGLEYISNIAAPRLADLRADLPEGVIHAASVEIPRPDGEPFRAIIPLATFDAPPSSQPTPLGDTGYSLQVVEIDDSPDLALITPGYEGAHSSLLKVRITPPAGTPFTRWVHHRFPEIAQDFVDSDQPGLPPQRRPADPSIRIGYIDASKVQVYILEDAAGRVSVLTRLPGASQPETTELSGSDAATILGGIELRITERWAHAERFDRPVITPENRRERDKIGTHEAAQLAVEVTSTRYPQWRRIAWLPYTRFLDAQAATTARSVNLPDGSTVSLAFGRLWHEFPGFALRLDDFEMVEYDHRGAPRDYQSTITVAPMSARADAAPSFTPYTHTASLNAPLRAPFNIHDPSRGAIPSLFGRLLAGLNPGQFKLSQAGWDRATWEQTRTLADQGQLPRPIVSFTILHVGNNPGIHIIALGGIFMAVGIPWAFYLKPWLLRRAKRNIQKQLAAGTYTKPQRTSRPAPERQKALIAPVEPKREPLPQAQPQKAES